MWNKLRLALKNLFKTPKEPRRDEVRGSDAQARFWAGVQEGRREAEANSTRRPS
jgi:hypothetical protein